MTKTRSGQSESARAKPALAGDGSPADRSSPAVTAVHLAVLYGRSIFVIFVFEKISPGPKIGLESHASRDSLQSAVKTQGLNLIIANLLAMLQ